jgi:hypothetical protein
LKYWDFLNKANYAIKKLEIKSEFISSLLRNPTFLSDISRKQGGHSEDSLLHAMKNGALLDILVTSIGKQKIIILIVSINEACAFCELKLKMIRDFVPEGTEFKVLYVSCQDLKDGSEGNYELQHAPSVDLFALPTLFLHVHQVVR